MPVAQPVGRDLSAIPSAPQTPATNPYRSSPPRKPPSNKPIILTALVGLSLLILVVGGAILGGFLKNSTSTDSATVASAETANNSNSESANEETNVPMQAPADKQTAQKTESPSPSKADGTSQIDPTKRTRKPVLKLAKVQPTKSQLVELQPASDSGLQRIEVPEGYSIAVPEGFMAANRSINRSTAIYRLHWKDGTALTLSVTDDRSITSDSKIPPIYASTSPDGKRTVRPIATSQATNSSETYKLNRMNVAFFEMEHNVSHEDMTEQVQTMFSGAMTPEMKRQYGHLMQEKVAFQSSLVMKAMDHHRMLDIVVVSERPQPFAVPEQWMDYLKTLQREEKTSKSRIPQPFLHRYNPPRPPATEPSK